MTVARLVPIALVAAVLPSSATAAPLVTTDPPLQPRFRQTIADYAIHCPDRSLTITAEGRERTSAIEPGQAVEFRSRWPTIVRIGTPLAVIVPWGSTPCSASFQASRLRTAV